MIAVKTRHDGPTYYIIGDFWETVARLKNHHARFRFRSRRWRWPGSYEELEKAMLPFGVLPVTLTQAQELQMIYDQASISPIQAWIKENCRLVQDGIQWWEKVRFKDKTSKKQAKVFNNLKEQVVTSLEACHLSPPELDRNQIQALQQVQRIMEKYLGRITKWAVMREKERQQEALLTRFEAEMGLSRESLLEAEAAGRGNSQALYEELGGLDWRPHEISELKHLAHQLLRINRKARAREEKKAS